MRYRVEGEAEAETEAAANPNTKFATSKMRCKLSAAAAAPAAANMMLPLDSSCPFGGRTERIISLLKEKTPLPREKRKKREKKEQTNEWLCSSQKEITKKKLPSSSLNHAHTRTNPHLPKEQRETESKKRKGSSHPLFKPRAHPPTSSPITELCMTYVYNPSRQQPRNIKPRQEPPVL